jgi:hypothetical protein
MFLKMPNEDTVLQGKDSVRLSGQAIRSSCSSAGGSATLPFRRNQLLQTVSSSRVQMYSRRLGAVSASISSTTHPPLPARQANQDHLASFQNPKSTRRARTVLAQVMSAARKVVVEQLQPNVRVLNSHRSSQGRGHIPELRIGDNKLPCFGRATHVEDLIPSAQKNITNGPIERRRDLITYIWTPCTATTLAQAAATILPSPAFYELLRVIITSFPLWIWQRNLKCLCHCRTELFI